MGLRLMRAVAVEALLWLVLPAVFLALYIGHFHVTAAAIGPHVRTIGIGVLALAVLRVLLYLTLGRGIRYHACVSVVLGITLSTLMLYYAVVLAGLQSWSKVVSWQLIASYLPQAGDMLEALQVSRWAALAAIVVPLLGWTAGAWYYLRRHDWVPQLVAAMSGKMRLLTLTGAVALLTIEAWNFATNVYAAQSEPFSLTIFPEDAVSHLDSNPLDRMRTATLDARQDQARLAYRPNPQALRRNVVVIVVDALRPGNMGVYGYPRATTPFLSEAARQGTLHKQVGMRASCAESACGLLSISSSVALHNFSSRPFTLQQVLRLHGYQVHMVLGGDHTNFYGLRKLYGDVDSYFDGSMATGSFSNDDRILAERLETFPDWSGKPTMFQFHMMSAHVLGKRLPQFQRFTPAKAYIGSPNIHTDGAGEVREASRNHYDNGVLQTDAMIASVLAVLEKKGYLANALVVVTADHGEAIGEHGLYAHSNGVHEEVLRIPFLLLSYGSPPPSLPPTSVNAAQIDIAPTILHHLQMPAPATWTGQALQKHEARRFTHFRQGGEAGIIVQEPTGGTWKFWQNQATGAEYAFDLQRDPRELNNLIQALSAEQKNSWRRELLAPGSSARDSQADQNSAPVKTVR